MLAAYVQMKMRMRKKTPMMTSLMMALLEATLVMQPLDAVLLLPLLP